MTAADYGANSPLARRFGQRVRELRRARGPLSQEDLAAGAGLHRTAIGRIERGEISLTLSTIARLAAALGISLNEFFQPFDEVLPCPRRS